MCVYVCVCVCLNIYAVFHSAVFQCLPFWPTQTEKKMQLIAKVKDTNEETRPFYFSQAHTTLLQLKSEVR